MQLSALYLHPLKSAAPLACDVLDIEPRGARHDRRWMLVDADGRFVSGRELGALLRLQARPIDAGLQLDWQGERWQVPLPAEGSTRIGVTVWKDRVEAALADPASQRWISDRLQRDLRLVYMDPAARRAVDPRYASDTDEVSFADGFPFLVLGRSSMDELNRRIGRELAITRFRPNLVITGAEPHAEDGWRRIRIGEVEFELVKPCVRCVFTTVDPDSGERDASGEPLATLKTYRRSDKGITFGINAIARGQGRITIGMPVERLA